MPNTAGQTVGRFAPSPTGAMHLGNARSALLAWLHSRWHGGQHILRFEDLDTGRVRNWAYDVTRQDLEWLGLDWDIEYLQSQRLDLYSNALAQLHIYPCTCTRKEILAAIQQSAGAPHGPEPIYMGTCRSGHIKPNHPAAMRWQVPDQTYQVTDALTQKTCCQHLPSTVGDFILRRNDGVYAYHLAVVVDDAAMGVTDVVRGADLWIATPRQIALQDHLHLSTPCYWHVPLMNNFNGQRLAKRAGAPPLQHHREAGTSPQRIIAQLAASLGWDVPPEISAYELLQHPAVTHLWTTTEKQIL